MKGTTKMLIFLVFVLLALFAVSYTISQQIDRVELEQVEFCNSKLAEDAGFIKVTHKYLGYETCIQP